jgi:hypothetical protein
MVGKIDATKWNKQRSQRDKFYEWMVKEIKERRGVDLSSRSEFSRQGLHVDNRSSESVELADVLPRRPAGWYDPAEQYPKLVNGSAVPAAVLAKARNVDRLNDPLPVPLAPQGVDAGYLDVTAVGGLSRNDIDGPLSSEEGAAQQISGDTTHFDQPMAHGVSDVMTSPGINLAFLIDKIKRAYENSRLETPAEDLELDTEIRRLEWEQRLRCMTAAPKPQFLRSILFLAWLITEVTHAQHA